MVVRSKSGESCGLGTIGFSEFGHLGQELLGGRVADARHAAEDAGFRLPIVVGREELGDRQFDLGKLFVEELDGLRDGFTR